MIDLGMFYSFQALICLYIPLEGHFFLLVYKYLKNKTFLFLKSNLAELSVTFLLCLKYIILSLLAFRVSAQESA